MSVGREQQGIRLHTRSWWAPERRHNASDQEKHGTTRDHRRHRGGLDAADQHRASCCTSTSAPSACRRPGCGCRTKEPPLNPRIVREPGLERDAGLRGGAAVGTPRLPFQGTMDTAPEYLASQPAAASRPLHRLGRRRPASADEAYTPASAAAPMTMVEGSSLELGEESLAR
jgi:hypothetical protein